MPNRITFILKHKLKHKNIFCDTQQNAKSEKEKFYFISTEFDYLLVGCYYSSVHIEAEAKRSMLSLLSVKDASTQRK